MNIKNPNVTKNLYTLRTSIVDFINNEHSYFVSSTKSYIMVALLHRSVSVSEIRTLLPLHVQRAVTVYEINTGNQITDLVTNAPVDHIVVGIRIDL